MKKEVVVAIVFGIILGLGVALFMILNLRKSSNNLSFFNKKAPSPVVKESMLEPLVISQPQNNQVTNKDSIAIKGKAVKNSLILIQSPAKDMTFKNDKGTFSVDFPLALGENRITISVYTKNQTTPQEKNLNIYYLDEL